MLKVNAFLHYTTGNLRTSGTCRPTFLFPFSPMFMALDPPPPPYLTSLWHFFSIVDWRSTLFCLFNVSSSKLSEVSRIQGWGVPGPCHMMIASLLPAARRTGSGPRLRWSAASSSAPHPGLPRAAVSRATTTRSTERWELLGGGTSCQNCFWYFSTNAAGKLLWAVNIPTGIGRIEPEWYTVYIVYLEFSRYIHLTEPQWYTVQTWSSVCIYIWLNHCDTLCILRVQ